MSAQKSTTVQQAFSFVSRMLSVTYLHEFNYFILFFQLIFLFYLIISTSPHEQYLLLLWQSGRLIWPYKTINRLVDGWICAKAGCSVLFYIFIYLNVHTLRYFSGDKYPQLEVDLYIMKCSDMQWWTFCVSSAFSHLGRELYFVISQSSGWQG